MRKIWLLLCVVILLAACQLGNSQLPTQGTSLAGPSLPTFIQSPASILPPPSPTLSGPLSPLRNSTPALEQPSLPNPPTAFPTPEVPTLSLGEPTWLGHGQIIDARFLPDETGVVVGWGNAITLNDLQSGGELWAVEAPAELMAFDVDPAGRQAAAALMDGSLLVIDVASGQSRQVTDSGSDVYWGDVRFSPDGKTLAYQFISPPSRGDPISLLDLASGKVTTIPHSEIDPGTQPILTWSPDGRTITLANINQAACSRLIDVASGETRLALGQPGHCLSPYSLAWDPDGASFITTQGLMTVEEPSLPERYSFPSGKFIGELQKGSPIASDILSKRVLFLDPQGKWLASRTSVNTFYYANTDQITVWDVDSGQVIRQMERSLPGNNSMRRIAAAFAGELEDSHLLMLYEDGTLTRWDFRSGQKEQELVHLLVSAPEPFMMRWSGDGRRMTFSGRYGGVTVWDTTSGQLIANFPGLVNSPALNHNGSQLALFDAQAAEQQVIDLAARKPVLQVKGAAVQSGAAFSLDGRLLAYSLGSWATLVDMQTGESLPLKPEPTDLPAPGQLVTGFTWSPDGQALAILAGAPGSPEAGGKIVLWQREGTAGFRELLALDCVIAGYSTPQTSLVAFNPSGRRVALQKMPSFEAGQSELVIYNLQENKILRSEKEYTLGTWVDDDTLLAVEAQYYQKLTRINVVTGEKVVGSKNNAGDNVYAPGGSYYMRSGGSRVIGIYDWQFGHILAKAEHDWLNSIGYDWSPEGSRIATYSAEGSVRVWPVVGPLLSTSAPQPTSTPTQKPTQTASEYCDQLLQRYQPAPEFQTYCDRDYGFAFDYPQGWRITFIAASGDSGSSSPIWVRKAQRFEVPDMSNYIRVDTYHLYDTMTLLSRVQNFFGYEERAFANKDYSSLTLGGRRAYAVLDRWQQDYSAAYLFFQHGQYYTIMEIKAISWAGLETNWQIARSLQTPGSAPDQNVIPQDLIDDSYQLLP